MNSDVSSDTVEASLQIDESRLRKEIHDIVDRSWGGLAQSLSRDFPDELGKFIRNSIDEVFARYLSGVVSPDLIEQIKSECIRRIEDFLAQALRGGLLDRQQVQLRAHIDDFLDEEFSEKLVLMPRRRATDEEKSSPGRRPVPAGAPAEEIDLREDDGIDVGGVLAGAPAKPAAPQPKLEQPVNPNSRPAPAAAASDVLRAERGKLVEKIPRTMYVGVREIIEVRLGLPTQDLTAGLAGGGVLTEHGIWMVETMSIKLLSPDGAFDIEARSPETQLVKKDVLKGTPFEALVANFGQWIWTVMPKQRGSHPLELSIAASVRDASGLPGNATLPNQTIPIEVAVSLTVTSRRLFWWLLSAAASSAVATVVGAITRDYWWPILKQWLPLP
jgi:hypothetical protein